MYPAAPPPTRLSRTKLRISVSTVDVSDQPSRTHGRTAGRRGKTLRCMRTRRSSALLRGAGERLELRVAGSHLPEGAFHLGSGTGPLALGEALDRLEDPMFDEESPFDRQRGQKRSQPLVVGSSP